MSASTTPSIKRKPLYITDDEFAAIKAVSHTDVRVDQINCAVRRIKSSDQRLQLRFPSVFRDGVILQFLSRFIIANEKIRVFTCGLSSNYLSGFYALRAIITSCAHIEQFKLRIGDLSLAPQQFIDAIAHSEMTSLHLRFDVVSDKAMLSICDALRGHCTLRHISIGCPSLSNVAIDALSKLFADAALHKLSLSMTEPLSLAHCAKLCEGIAQSKTLQHLDVEDCALADDGAMAELMRMLSTNKRITTLTIGNNGASSIRPFFESVRILEHIEKLIVAESQIYVATSTPAQRIDLDVISASVAELNQRGTLRVLQLPLFIFSDTADAALERFVDALGTADSAISTLSLFPLFEHLDRASDDSDPVFCAKLAHFFHLLFKGLAEVQTLKKLYLEMIGSEQHFLTRATADSFLGFLRRTRVHELYVPFARMAALNGEILSDGFPRCRELLSVRDDSVDETWDKKVNDADVRCLVAAHEQCKSNLLVEIAKHMEIKDVADLIVKFCGTEADCTLWW